MPLPIPPHKPAPAQNRSPQPSLWQPPAKPSQDASAPDGNRFHSAGLEAAHAVERTPTPTERNLKTLTEMDRREAESLGLYPMEPTGTPVMMSAREAAGARDFRAEMRRIDPEGRLQEKAEFIRAYAPGANPGSALPTGPMRYSLGYSCELPARELPPETFMTIHSHPKHPLAEGFPSRGDYLAANREGKLHEDYREMMYNPRTDTFFRFDGRAYPPAFAEAKFPSD